MMAEEGHEWQLADIAPAVEIPVKLMVQKQHGQTAAVSLLGGWCLGLWCLYGFFRLHVPPSLCLMPGFWSFHTLSFYTPLLFPSSLSSFTINLLFPALLPGALQSHHTPSAATCFL